MKNYQIQLYSSILGRDVPVRILLPSGSSLKCLILLHGYNGNHDHWCKNSHIAELAEQHQLAVIMPSCGNDYYEDTNEDIPRFIGEEVVAYARKALPISTAREDLYIAGESMGGFGSLLIGAKFHRQFGKIASLSGAFIIPDVVIGNQGVLGNADPYYFKKVFGDFASLEGSARDPLAEAIRVSRQDRMPPVYLMCGNKDVLYRGNRKTADMLSKHGVETVWREGEGGHTWDFWNTYLPDLIAWLVSQ